MKDLTGKYCLVVGKNIPEDGTVVKALRYMGFTLPDVPGPVIPRPYWETDSLFQWYVQGEQKKLPYCAEHFLQPLPDLDEPVEDSETKSLDKPVTTE